MIIGQMHSILQDLPDSIITYFYYLEVLYFLALQHHHVQSASFCPSMQSLHQQKSESICYFMRIHWQYCA